MSGPLAMSLAFAGVAAARLVTSPRDVTSIDEARRHLLAAIDELDRLAVGSMILVNIRYLSTCPPGYNTVLGYLATHNPEMLELMDQDPSATLEDGVWCSSRTLQLGLQAITVPSCPWLSLDFKIKSQTAYPLNVLQERFSGPQEAAA